MNALENLQTQGLPWLSAPYEAFQAIPKVPEWRQDPPIFANLEQQMTEFAAQQKPVLTELHKHYVFAPDSAVVNFLNEHPAIPQLLLDAFPHLQSSLGAGAIFNLRAPIDDDGRRTLYAIIVWSGEVEVIRAALAKFDDDWWVKHSHQAAGRLAFVYELV